MDLTCEHNPARATRRAHLEAPNGFDSKNSLNTELISSGLLAAMVKPTSTGYDRNCDRYWKPHKPKSETTFLPENSVLQNPEYINSEKLISSHCK